MVLTNLMLNDIETQVELSYTNLEIVIAFI